MRPELVTTQNGFLKITTKQERYRGTAYSSGQVMSWNKFCMTGGLIEVQYVLPGSPGLEGLWPAIWMLGNLGRATYDVRAGRALLGAGWLGRARQRPALL